MAKNTDEVIEWIISNMQRRGWSLRETASRAGIAHSAISEVLQNQRTISLHVARSLAKVFNTPTVNVLEWGNLVEPSPSMSSDLRELVHIYDSLDMQDKETLLKYARFMKREGVK